MSELPESWEETRLDEICEVVQGQSPPGNSYNSAGAGMPFFQGKAEFGELRPVVGKWTTEAKKLARQDSVLLSIRAPVGPTNLAPCECAIGRGLAALHPLDRIDSRYVLFALRATVNNLEKHATGTTFGAVSGAEVRAHRVPLPPLAEQQRIVAAIEEHFSRLDAAEESLRRGQQRIGVMRRAVLVRALGGNWPDIQLADVASVDAGPAFKSQFFQGPEQGIRLLRGDNIEPGRLRWANARTWPESLLGGFEHLFVEESDLILAMDRPLVSAGLKLAPVRKDDLPALLVQRVARIRARENVLTEFLHLALQSPEFVPHLIADQTGTQLPHITLDGIRSYRVPLPLLADQRRIVAEVERQLSLVDALAAATAAALKRSAALRRSILERAFTGKLVPQDSRDEPASVLLDRIRAERAVEAPARKTRRSRSGD